MTRHIRADKLARYRAGDLGTRESARVRAHLDGCARCTAAADDLAAVSTFLASVPAPPMPDDITARIEAALAAEAASRAASPAVPAARGPVPVAPGRDGVTRRAAVRNPKIWSGGWLRSPVTLRVAAGAAVAVVVLGGGFAAIRLAGSSGTSGTSGSSRPQKAAAPRRAAVRRAPRPEHQRGRARGRPSPTLTYRAGGQSRPFTVLTSSADLGPGTLGREIGQLVPGSEGSPECTSAARGPALSGSRRGTPVSLRRSSRRA